jgi:hypothetical protein
MKRSKLMKLKSYKCFENKIKLPNPYRRPMDQAIKPLVDAMNASDLFTTHSSCGGHFPPPKNNSTKGVCALILFQTLPIKAERIIEDLAVFIAQETERNSQRLFCSIELSKWYTAALESRKRKCTLYRHYCLKILPRFTSVSDVMKRRDVDVGIVALTRIIEKFPLARRR